MDFLTEFSTTWADPQMRHAMVVHWPIVMAVLCVPAALAVAFSGGKSATLRCVGLICAVLMLASGWVAMRSGGNAENSVRGSTSDAAEAVLEEHEELGEKVPVFAFIGATLIGLTFIPKRGVRLGAAWLGAAIYLFIAGWLANTAHHGGQLVYAHGIGTPVIATPSAPSSDGDAAAVTDPRVAFFASDVRPILVAHCHKCHNPDRMRRSGDLDQTSMAGLLTGGESGPAIVPGKPEASLLMKRVRGEMPGEDIMPPDGKLSDEDVAKLDRWIREGAVWE
jgi:uncharacterized membrane protein